ncbi:MAG: acylphosphatase [Alphaproteobacteria bacterium]|nr:acylphosphatase [Alphaproteobacteria bacterium]
MTDAEYERIIHVIVRGRVQGVGYRDWTQAQANGRGLYGWVRNRSDGSVEAVFAGDADNVAAMADSLMRGPPRAKVSAIEVNESDIRALDANFGARFIVRPTV